MNVAAPTQPQDRRPKAQSTRVAARKQAAADAEAVGIRVDGREYTINPNDLTGRVEFEIRREIGMGLAELQERLTTSPGIDYLGMFLWAVRHAHGEDVDLMTVLEGVSAGSDVEILTELPDAPKA